MYLLGVNLALRGGTEIKRLCQPGFKEQIVPHVDGDGFECLKFNEDAKSKTNQGGVKKQAQLPKVSTCIQVVKILIGVRCDCIKCT